MKRIPPTALSDAPRGFDRALTVLVVARDRDTASAVEAALEREGFAAAVETRTLDEALAARSSACELVIVVEPEDGPHADDELTTLAEASPLAHVVVVCAPGRPNPEALVWRGVDGVVIDPGAIELLGPIARAVLGGYVAVPRSARSVVSAPALSARERRMLALAAEGLTNREIADRLFLAESTVKRHLSSAFRRLGVNSRREAAAVLRGLGAPPDPGSQG